MSLRSYSDAKILRLGAITLVLMLLVMAAAFNLSKFPGFGGSLYRAEFKDASGLHQGNMVQVAGMRVGRVKEIELETQQGAGDLRGRPRRRVRHREPGLDRGAQPARREVPRAVAGRVRPARRGRRDPGRPHPVGVRHRRRLRRPDDDHRADRHRPAPAGAQRRRPTPWTPPARTSRPACEGISRLSQTVASRDEEIQSLLASSRNVSEVLADRSQDIVQLMDRSDLVFQELQKRKAAIHRLLVNARILADELRGLAEDNQAQIGPALREVDDLLDLLISQGEGAQGHPGGRRALRLDPRQHHRHRPLVRRLRLQPGRHPDRRVPARPPRNGRVTPHAEPGQRTRARRRGGGAAAHRDVLHVPRRRGDPHRHRALPARGQRLQGHRRPGPRRQRRPGDRGDPRGQLGARRDGVRREVPAARPTPRP